MLINITGKIDEAWANTTVGWNDAKSREFQSGALNHIRGTMQYFTQISDGINSSMSNHLSILRAHIPFKAPEYHDELS
jgi:hypothetical protein